MAAIMVPLLFMVRSASFVFSRLCIQYLEVIVLLGEELDEFSESRCIFLSDLCPMCDSSNSFHVAIRSPMDTECFRRRIPFFYGFCEKPNKS